MPAFQALPIPVLIGLTRFIVAPIPNTYTKYLLSKPSIYYNSTTEEVNIDIILTLDLTLTLLTL